MNLFARILLMTLSSSAMAAPDTLPPHWQQLAEAADRQLKQAGPPAMEVSWRLPAERVLVLARPDEDLVLAYQIDRKTTGMPQADGLAINCNFAIGNLYCIAPGEQEAAIAVMPHEDLWEGLKAHMAEFVGKIESARKSSLRRQFEQAPAPLFDLRRQRHPFEWGGEHETVENAQAFLEAVTKPGIPFVSIWPPPPKLAAHDDDWSYDGDVVTLEKTGRCTMLATSAERTVLHHQSAKESVKTVYRWRQPIDWSTLDGGRIAKDSVFLRGVYTGPAAGYGIEYLRGWKAPQLAADGTLPDRAKYDVKHWSMDLKLPDEAGMRERVYYAVTFLQKMCGKQGNR